MQNFIFTEMYLSVSSMQKARAELPYGLFSEESLVLLLDNDSK